MLSTKQSTDNVFNRMAGSSAIVSNTTAKILAMQSWWAAKACSQRLHVSAGILF